MFCALFSANSMQPLRANIRRYTGDLLDILIEKGMKITYIFGDLRHLVMSAGRSPWSGR